MSEHSRRFELHRTVDATGISGTGIVAEGIQFRDGTCAMRWLTATASTAMYGSIADVVTIHGHEGQTRVAWVDEPDASRTIPWPPSEELVERVVDRIQTVVALDDDEAYNAYRAVLDAIGGES